MRTSVKDSGGGDTKYTLIPRLVPEDRSVKEKKAVRDDGIGIPHQVLEVPRPCAQWDFRT